MSAGFLGSFRRYGLATLAPASVSAVQFIMQMTLLHSLEAGEFGTFSFMLTLVQFGYSVSNALIATPYTLTINQSDLDYEKPSIFFSVNIILCFVWGLICFVGSVLLGKVSVAPLFGFLAVLSMVRWFGRAHLYAAHRPTQAAISDIIYSASLLIFIAVIWLTRLTIGLAALVSCISLSIGLIAMGSDFWRLQIGSFRFGGLRSYGKIWQEQARWTLLGVTTSEATANAHSYFVTFFAGPVAFAPIAAASLFLKPIPLVLTSLTQLERPVMSRAIAKGDFATAIRANKFFKTSVLSAWALTVVTGIVILTIFPHIFVKSSYDLNTIAIAFAFWCGIIFLLSWSTPESVLLQAAGKFQKLAELGVLSAIISILGVAFFFIILGPVYSLVGILMGQAVTSTRIMQMSRTWKLSCADEGPLVT